MIRRRTLCAISILFLTAWTHAARGEELLDVGVAQVPAGAVGPFTVSFYSNSIIPLTAAIEVGISYDSEHVPIAADSFGNPDCTADPAAGKSDTTFTFLPAGCSGVGCSAIHASVRSLTDSSPIPQDVDLFTCNIHPPFGQGRDSYILTIAYSSGSDQLGNPVSLSSSDGFALVYESTPGDCNGDGVVPIAEVISAVTDALGTKPADCQAADVNQDGTVDVSELMMIVGTSLTCGPTWPCWFHGGAPRGVLRDARAAAVGQP